MRVNIYAEELTDKVEVISKEIEGRTYHAVRFYMELPATVGLCKGCGSVETAEQREYDKDCKCGGLFVRQNVSGPFEHRPGDDDSAAVTFWGRRQLRSLFVKAIAELDKFEASR
jgi:hypothetical protein